MAKTLKPEDQLPLQHMEPGVTRFRHAYGPRHRVAQHFNKPSRTQQHFKDECDVNRIMARYAQSGVLPQGGRPKHFIEAGALEFQEALNLVITAEEAFASLPSATRERFANNPSLLLSFLEDPANRPEAVKLGLIPPGDTPTPTPAPEPAKGPQNAPETPSRGV